MITTKLNARSRCGLHLLLGLLMFSGCDASQLPPPSSLTLTTTADAIPAPMKSKESRMWMTVGEHRFAITLADNESAQALAALLPLTLDMVELNGNEKYADLTQQLPVNASRPGTIHSGDIMLYGSNTLVVFYATFKSSYSYTRLGRVDDHTGLAEALGRRGVRVVFLTD